MMQFFDQLDPRLHVALGRLDPETPQDLLVQSFARQHQGYLINISDVFRGNNRFFRDTAKKRDFRFQIGREVPVSAAKQDVGLDADLA